MTLDNMTYTLKILDFIYYRLYYLLQKTNAKDIAEYVSSIWFVILLSTNIIVTLKQFGFHPLNHLPSFRVYAIILFAPLSFIMYLLFLRNKRFLQIAVRYANETKQERIIGNIILISYVVATFAALILL